MITLFLLLTAACETVGPTLQETGAAGQRPATRTPAAPPTQSDPSTPAPTEIPAPRIEVDPADLQGRTVRLLHAFPLEAAEELAGLVQTFNRENEWGLKVEAAASGSLDDLANEIEAGLEAGEPPDLAVAYPYQVLGWDAELVNLREYAQDPAWGLPGGEAEDFYAPFWEVESGEGEMPGFPALRSGMLLYYNRSWAQELGFTRPPETPQEFKRQACAASAAVREDDDPENDLTGGWVVSTQPSSLLGWISAFGGEPVQPAGGYRFNTSPVQEAFTFLRDLHDSGCAWLSESDPPEDAFAHRQALFASGSVTGLPFQEKAFGQVQNRDDWTVLPFPSPEGEPAITVYGPDYTLFATTPEQQLAAWLLVRYLTAPENAARLSESAGSFPLSAASLQHYTRGLDERPQLAAAFELLPYARAEPTQASWATVRWALFDAGTQLFRYYFTPEGIPNLVKLLDQTAKDLHAAQE